jgi:hypothetical protein
LSKSLYIYTLCCIESVNLHERFSIILKCLTEDDFMNQRRKNNNKVVTRYHKKNNSTQQLHQNKWFSFLFLLGLILLPIILYWLFQT